MGKRLIVIIVYSIVHVSCIVNDSYVIGPNRFEKDIMRMEAILKRSDLGDASASYELANIYGITFKSEAKRYEYLYLAKEQGSEAAKETIDDLEQTYGKKYMKAKKQKFQRGNGKK